MMASYEGGMDIEKSPRNPRKDHQGLRQSAGRPDRRAGADAGEAAWACRKLRLPSASITLEEALHLLHGNRRLAGEINPLIHEGDGTVKALDAKFNFDSNALYRQEEIVAMRDLDEKIRMKSGPRNSTSPTSRSTATSAAW